MAKNNYPQGGFIPSSQKNRRDEENRRGGDPRGDRRPSPRDEEEEEFNRKSPSSPQTPPPVPLSPVDKIKQKDSNFSEKVFLDKAQTAFFHIQRAWSKNDLEPARQYLSEANFQRMDMQLEEYREKGWFNKSENLVIGGIRIINAGVEGEHDFITVEVRASMADFTVDSRGKIVEGSKKITPFQEYWTFVRKQGIKTSKDGGRTVAHNCPNCGAPTRPGQSAHCEYCDSIVTSADFDWVMDTITQPGEG